MRHLLLALSVVCFLMPAPAQAEIEPEKKQDIVHLLDMIGVFKAADMMMQAMVDHYAKALKQMRPDLDDAQMAIALDEVKVYMSKEVESGSFAEYIYPIYDKHFTHQEIKDLVTFYETPTGKKAIEVLPVTVQEGMVAGQKWAQDIMPGMQAAVEKRLQEAQGAE